MEIYNGEKERRVISNYRRKATIIDYNGEIWKFLNKKRS
jgi:hypothetical protein